MEQEISKIEIVSPEQTTPTIKVTEVLATHHKISPITLGVLILIIITGIASWTALYFQPKSELVVAPIVDQFAGWKTYINSQYGFELKYPENWIIQSEDSLSVVIANDKLENNLHGPGIPPGPNGLWLDIYKTSCIPTQGFSTELKKPDIFYKTICQNGFLIDVGGWQNNPNLVSDQSLLNQILSTFKFTNSTTTPDTSNWKTYTNSQYGFEFEYPINWIAENTKDIEILFGPAGVDDRSFIMQSIDLSVSDQSKYSSLENFANQQAGKEDNSTEKIILENISLDKIPAIKIRNQNSYDYDRLVFFYQGKAFVLHDNGTLNHESNEFKQILSTFKFVDKNQTNSSIKVPTLYPGAIWKEEVNNPKDSGFFIYYDNFDYQSDVKNRQTNYIVPTGHLWTTTINNLNDVWAKRAEFEKYYSDQLGSSDWSWDKSLADRKIRVTGPSADSPISSVWGYIKTQNNKLKMIGFSYYISKFTDTGGGGPVEVKCPCDLELKVFVSDDVDLNTLTFK